MLQQEHWDALSVYLFVATTLPLLSILDLSTVGTGQCSRDALLATTAAAQRAEQLDYRRYWVAEHHNFPAVASTSPAVLMAHLAASTSTISVGSGGVMLPNHAPLAIAEQFAMLEALHPGRIDLGIGRAPGTDGRTALALRRGVRDDGPDAFPQNVLDVMGLLGDRRRDGGLDESFIATPVHTSTPTVVLLGSSDYSAQLAGMLGLPFSFAHHFAAAGAESAVAHYRAAFRPSALLEEPYVIVATAAIAANTTEEAERIALPGRLMTLNIRRNRMAPIPSIEEAEADPDRGQALMMSEDRTVGDTDYVVGELAKLGENMGASELMITTVTHSLDHRLASMELIAQAWSAKQLDLS